jgi:FkbM family methyltransferase
MISRFLSDREKENNAGEPSTAGKTFMVLINRLKNSSVLFLRRFGNVVRLLLPFKLSRTVLNFAYNRLPYKGKAAFYSAFAKMYRGSNGSSNRTLQADWKVRFARKSIRLPLAGPAMLLDWDLAVSLVGHDSKVVRSYELLLDSPFRPRVFFDVGANYGLHSLLFAMQGVRTVSFEPNPECHDYLRRVAKLNRLDCDIQSLALGEEEGSVELLFPNGETWLGSVDLGVQAALRKQFSSFSKMRIAKSTMDSFVEKSGNVPDLIKIDTEGSELNVLRGARHVLAKYHPAIVFECRSADGYRSDVHSFLLEMGYLVAGLPLHKLHGSQPLSLSEFEASDIDDFIALPNGKLGWIDRQMSIAVGQNVV